ncbi:MAG: hypothetical protein IKD79_04105 [Oscillospiraceae bacterium]|nr:hypothetical protein [Oscillospiraceae bacterium]
MKRFFSLLLYAALLAAMGVVSAHAAEIDSLEVTFLRQYHSISNENGEIELYYDLTRVPQNYPYREKIDAVLAADYQDYANQIEGLEEYLDIPNAQFFYTMTGDVTYNRDGVLSLCYAMDWFMGGVYNYGWHGITFDLDTGEQTGMDDLLDMSAEALMEILRPIMLDYAENNGGWERNELERIVNGYILDDLDFYVEWNREIILCIPQYELGPGASGAMLIPTGLYCGEEEEKSLLDILLSPSGGAAEGLEPTEISLTPSEQYEINIFLSNFAEQNGFAEYPGRETHRVAIQADFANAYCKINRHSAIEYRQANGTSYETVSLSEVNSILDRFFGKALTDEEAASGYASTQRGFYRDGRFWYPAADGEAHNCFAVATSMAEVYNHVFYVNFTIYALDLDTYFNDGIVRAYYELTPAAAAASPDLEIEGFGAALVEPYDMNSRATYRLVEWVTW